MNRGAAVNLVLGAVGIAALFTLFHQGMKMASRFQKPKMPAPTGKIDLGAGNASALKDLQAQIGKGLGKLSSDSEDDVAVQPVSVAPVSAGPPPAPIVVVRYVTVNQPAQGTIATAAQVSTLPGTAAGSVAYPRLPSPPIVRLPLGSYPPPTSIR